MNTDQMREEKHRLVIESQHIFNKWNAMATARWFYYEKREDGIFDRMSADMETIWKEYQAVTDQWMKLDLEIIAIERAAMDVPKVQSAPKFAPGTYMLLVKPGSRPVTLPDPESRPVTTLEMLQAEANGRTPGIHLSDVFATPECHHIFNIHYTLDGVNYRGCANCAYDEVVPSYRAEIVDAAVREDGE